MFQRFLVYKILLNHRLALVIHISVWKNAQATYWLYLGTFKALMSPILDILHNTKLKKQYSR